MDIFGHYSISNKPNLVLRTHGYLTNLRVNEPLAWQARGLVCPPRLTRSCILVVCQCGHVQQDCECGTAEQPGDQIRIHEYRLYKDWTEITQIMWDS